MFAGPIQPVYYLYSRNIMQDTCFCFPTEVPSSNPQTSQPLTSRAQEFTAYVESFDLKIARGLHNQSSQLTIRRKQLFDQIKDVRDQQTLLLNDLKKKENYFEQHYYRFLRQDVAKFEKYNEFFRREFEALERKIAEGQQQNRRRKVVIVGLKARLTQLIKQRRRKNQSVGTHSISTPTTTDVSIRLVTEPDHKTQRPKQTMSSCKELPKLTYRYLQPINQSSRRQIRNEECRHLQLLLELFTFRKDDRKNKQWSWFEQVIFKPRNFDKLVEYVRRRMDFIRMSV